MTHLADTTLALSLVNERPLLDASIPEPERKRVLAQWRFEPTEIAEPLACQVYDVRRTGPTSLRQIDPDGVQVLWLPDRCRGAVRCGGSVEWSTGASPLDLVVAWTRVTPQGS
jgi:hypothetical protein